MNTRAIAVLVGCVVYLVLIIISYVLHRLAFGDVGGPYPTWYSGGELILNGTKAVAPGLIAGWLFRDPKFGLGAVVGAVGGLSEIILSAVVVGPPFLEYLDRIAVMTVLAMLVAGCTNGVASIAGASLHARRKPSNFSSSGRDISATGADARRST